MKNFVTSVIVLLVSFAFTSSAQAQAACFDWTCTGGNCELDASCSENAPLDFRWDFGDGTPLVSSWPGPPDPTIGHTYILNPPDTGYYVTLSVGYRFIGYYFITCFVQIRSNIGPPATTFSGTCS